MYINIPSTLKKILLLICTWVLLCGNDFKPLYARTPAFIYTAFAIVVILFFVEKDTIRASKDLWLLGVYLLIIVYEILEMNFWSMFPYATRTYVVRYSLFLALIVFNLNIGMINDVLDYVKIYGVAISIGFFAMYALTGQKGSFLGSYQNVACAMCVCMLTVEINMLIDEKWKKRDLCMFLLYLATLMMTGKRTFLVIPFVALIVLANFGNSILPLSVKRKRLFFLLVILAIGGVAALFIKPDMLLSITRIFEADNDDVMSGRDRLWALAIYLWQTSPIRGIGMGGFTNFIRNNRMFTYTFMRVQLIAAAHNIYFQLLCENGIIGMALFIFLFVYNLGLAIRNMILVQRVKDLKVVRCAYFAILIQIWLLIYGVTGNPLFVIYQFFIYMFSMMVSQSVKTELKLIKERENG